jgi:hypothetical protein
MGRAVGSEAAGRFDRAFYLRNLLPDFAQGGWEEGYPASNPPKVGCPV